MPSNDFCLTDFVESQYSYTQTLKTDHIGVVKERLCSSSLSRHSLKRKSRVGQWWMRDLHFNSALPFTLGLDETKYKL